MSSIAQSSGEKVSRREDIFGLPLRVGVDASEHGGAEATGATLVEPECSGRSVGGDFGGVVGVDHAHKDLRVAGEVVVGEPCGGNLTRRVAEDSCENGESLGFAAGSDGLSGERESLLYESSQMVWQDDVRPARLRS